jgi:hypothetical protein
MALLRLAFPEVDHWPPMSAADVSTLQAKARFCQQLARLGLSKRGAARELSRRWRKTREGTVRGWMHPKAWNRRPPESAMDLFDRLIEASELRARAVALETGT